MTELVLAVAVGLLIVLAPLEVRAWRRWGGRVPRGVREAALPIVLVVVSACVYRPLVQGHQATTWDNNYGPLKTLEAEEMLSHHELFGWSDYENSGFPVHTLYPLAGAMMQVAIHALPGVTLERSQAWCTWLGMVAIMLACYLAGRMYYGPVVGVIAGLAALLDPGDWWMGGHYSTVDVGMWIQTVSTALVVAGLALWPWAVANGRWGSIVLTGVTLGLATLFHPQAMMLTANAGVVMMLALLATRKPGPLAVLLRTAGIVGVTLACSAFWVIPYLAKGEYNEFPPGTPITSHEMWDQFIHSSLLHGLAFWLGIAMVGGLLVVRRRDPYSRFMALVVPTFIVIFTLDGLNLLHLRNPNGGSFIDRLQLQRMYYLVRPEAFILSAYALGKPLLGAIRNFAGATGGWASTLNRIFVAVVAGVLIQLPGVGFPGVPGDPQPQGGKGPDWPNAGLALDYAKTLMKPGEKVALHLENMNNHDLVLPAAEREMKILKIGTDAAMMFKYKFSSEDPELLGRVGGSVLVSRGALPDQLRKLPLAKTFGTFEVRNLPHLDRAWMNGPGKVEIVSWQNEEIRLKVTGSAPTSKVQLALGYYDTWRTDDGVPTKSFVFKDATFSELPAHDGEMVVRYHAPRQQWYGLAVSLLGLVLVAASGFAVRGKRAAVEVPAPAAAPVPPIAAV